MRLDATVFFHTMFCFRAGLTPVAKIFWSPKGIAMFRMEETNQHAIKQECGQQ